MLPAPRGLNSHDEALLRQAVRILEGESFIGKLTELTGEPVTMLMQRLPRTVSGHIHRAVRSALSQALGLALYRMGGSGFPEPPLLFQVASGVTGGVSGFFGMGALALELPLTTALMLRSIAQIAARNGETLNQPAARLACLEVFALGPHGKRGASGETSYYAARAFLARTVAEAAQTMIERGAAGASAPVIVELLGSIGSRFGMVVSEKVAAGAIPVIGAFGGAAINMAFMQHFQRLARAHFAIRRLERHYGPDCVATRYRVHSAAL
jgi:hypothetical protein